MYEPASDAFTSRPIADFIAHQGDYCFADGAGGCGLIEPPVPNFLTWHDAGTGVTAQIDYAAVAERWLHEESSGLLSCGTNCRGQVLVVPQPDGTARVSVIVETKSAMSWADKEVPRPMRFGHKAVDVLDGARPTLGYTRLEVEFGLPGANGPMPDLMQILYAPRNGETVYSIKFYGQAKGTVRGKPAVLEVVQEGLSLNPPMGRMSDGLPAEISVKWIDKPGRGPGPVSK